MERFMITLTPTLTEQTNAYQINGVNCSFSNGDVTFVTSGEDVVNIIGRPAYITITPLGVSSSDYKHNVMVTLDESMTPTVIFDGRNSESCFEVYMYHECKIVFKENDATDCLAPSDIDKIVNESDVKAEEPKPDNIMKIGICYTNDKPLIQKTAPVKDSATNVESSNANITELTSYDKVMNAVYKLFEENSPIPYDREIFNDLCGDGIRMEASNWKCSMHPYIVTFQRDSLPKYSNVLHINIEKTKKFHNGYSCGMYTNRGVLKMLLIFNDKGYLARLVTSSKLTKSEEYLNQEIRDLFKEINDAKNECCKSKYTFIEDLMDVDLPAECGIHC